MLFISTLKRCFLIALSSVIVWWPLCDSSGLDSCIVPRLIESLRWLMTSCLFILVTRWLRNLIIFGKLWLVLMCSSGKGKRSLYLLVALRCLNVS